MKALSEVLALLIRDAKEGIDQNEKHPSPTSEKKIAELEAKVTAWKEVALLMQEKKATMRQLTDRDVIW